MSYRAWARLAHRYNTQWVQKYSLGPTRREVGRILLPLLEADPDLRILDVGCGTGQLAGEILAVHGDADYLGIDVTEEMIRVAEANNAGPRLTFRHVSVDDFPAEETFDVIVCTHAFPYFPDKAGAMAKLAALCRPGGRVILVSSSTNNPWDLLVNLTVKAHTSRARYLSIKEMRALFSAAGFRVSRVSVIRERWYMPTIALFDAERKGGL